MKLADHLQNLRTEKKALLATNFYNLETLMGVLKAAKLEESALILQLTESSIRYMGLENSIALARTALRTNGVQGWIHLDHGASFELAERCLLAGVDSVMIDGSELPLEENIKLTQKVVRRARDFGAHVEAELGYVAKLGQDADRVEYTDPDVAKMFVQETGVNALAVAVGTAHGFYKSEPQLDFPRLRKIAEQSSAVLVLHGGSGVPAEQLQMAIACGICKINLATEIKNIFMRTLKDSLAQNEEIDLRKVFPPATEAVTNLVREKLRIINQPAARRTADWPATL